MGNQIAYPLDLMNQTALTILQKAQDAMVTHQSTWKIIQDWIDHSAPTDSQMGIGWPDVRSYLSNVLDSHAQRLQASYQWQIDTAQAIINAVQQITTVEQENTNGFTVGSGSTGSSPHGGGHLSAR